MAKTLSSPVTSRNEHALHRNKKGKRVLVAVQPVATHTGGVDRNPWRGRCVCTVARRHPHGWRGWQSSSLHYAVIMNPCRAQMGVGCWIEYGGKCVWCVTFSYSTQSHNAQSPLAHHAGKGRFLFQFEKSIPSGYAFCLFRN